LLFCCHTQTNMEVKENPLTEAQKKDIRAAFDKQDVDKNGTLSKQELRAVLENTLHRKISDRLFDSYLQLQFHASDTDFNGVIDFNEFCSLYSKIYLNPELPISLKPKEGSSHNVTLETGENAPKIKKEEVALSEGEIAEAKAQFKTYDKDNSGTIDKAELGELLVHVMGKKMAPAMVQRFVSAQMQLADKDGSGEIDFNEFLGVYSKLVNNAAGGPAVGVAMPGMGMPLPGMGAAPRKR